jgi:AraC family transcriptional regulator, transcriptional activator of pobA
VASQKSIVRIFQEINDLFAVTGSVQQARFKDIHIFRYEDLGENLIITIPPYRRTFYQVAILEPSDNVGTFSINHSDFAPRQSSLFFVSPEHLFSWRREQSLPLAGFVLYFKADFLGISSNHIAERFPFFSLTEVNVFQPDTKQQEELKHIFGLMLNEYNAMNTPNEREIVRSYLNIILQKCNALHAAYTEREQTQIRSVTVFNRFRHLINNYYLTKRTVNEFAELLHITPSYLNNIVKETSGRTAREFIVERLLVEAKNLLAHTAMDIAEISHSLNFAEPSHFSKFFKHEIGVTPLAFRKTSRQQSHFVHVQK